jgi:hypothetical protein
VEELLHQPQLALAPDERRLERLCSQPAAAAGLDVERTPQPLRLGLALELELARIAVRNRGLARATCGLADEDGAGLRRGLHPRGGIDEIAGDHSLALGTDRHRRLAGEDAGARSQAAAKSGDRVDELEPGPHRSLGVVFLRGRRSPYRHHRVADELLHVSAVAADHGSSRVEVAGEQLAHLLGVARLRQWREPDEVGEKDGDEAAFDGGRGNGGDRLASRLVERATALAAEALARLVRRPARRAHDRERRAALGAELPPRAVLVAAFRAAHAQTIRRFRRSSDVGVRPDEAAAEHPALELIDHAPVDLALGILVRRRVADVLSGDLQRDRLRRVVDTPDGARRHDVMLVIAGHDEVALAGLVAGPGARPHVAVRPLDVVALDAV